MPRSGRCLCGHYRFEVSAEPLWIAYCHCESCRRFNAAPTAVYVGYPASRVRFQPAEPPCFSSSKEVRRAFCEHCSTPLAYSAEWFPGEIHLFRSNFDRLDDLHPTRHVLFNEREPDFEVYDDLPRYGTDPGQVIGWGPRPAIRVLFLCTANSARSILAEAILNLRDHAIGERRVRGHSAGSDPAGAVNPAALALLEGQRYRLDHLRSKSWDEFSTAAAPNDSSSQIRPTIDWVITLCDQAAAEACPVFPGPARQRHWSLPDPVSAAATSAAATIDAAAFAETWQAIEERIAAFLDELDQAEVRNPSAPR